MQAIDEQLNLTHLENISGIPGVKTDDMYDGIIGPIPYGDNEKPPAYIKCAAKTSRNTGLDTNYQAQGAIRKQNEFIVIDDDNNDVKEVVV
jgi:hypothetical protein